MLSDLGPITEYNLRLAEETEALKLAPSVVEAGVRAVLSDASKGLYYVAVVEDTVIGQLMITYEWSDWRNGNIWWIQSVYVKHEFRRQGVFRMLFHHVRDLARLDKNVCGLRLYMHAENSRARKSYLDLGMSQTHYQVFELDFSAIRGSCTQ